MSVQVDQAQSHTQWRDGVKFRVHLRFSNTASRDSCTKARGRYKDDHTGKEVDWICAAKQKVGTVELRVWLLAKSPSRAKKALPHRPGTGNLKTYMMVGASEEPGLPEFQHLPEY